MSIVFPLVRFKFVFKLLIPVDVGNEKRVKFFHHKLEVKSLVYQTLVVKLLYFLLGGVASEQRSAQTEDRRAVPLGSVR